MPVTRVFLFSSSHLLLNPLGHMTFCNITLNNIVGSGPSCLKPILTAKESDLFLQCINFHRLKLTVSSSRSMYLNVKFIVCSLDFFQNRNTYWYSAYTLSVILCNLFLSTVAKILYTKSSNA